jgi:hypothetical protein
MSKTTVRRKIKFTFEMSGKHLPNFPWPWMDDETAFLSCFLWLSIGFNNCLGCRHHLPRLCADLFVAVAAETAEIDAPL